MNKAALNVYEAIRREGTQKNVLDQMQTRMDLYDYLGYHAYEQKLDELFAQGKNQLAQRPETPSDSEITASYRDGCCIG